MSDTLTKNDTPQHESQRTPSKKGLLIVVALIILLVGGITATLYWAAEKNNKQNLAAGIEVVRVAITADGFVPANLHIKPNTQVVWTNKDTVSHAVVLQDGNAQPLNISERLAPQESFSTVLDEERDYFVRSPTDGDKFQGVIKVKSKANSNE